MSALTLMKMFHIHCLMYCALTQSLSSKRFNIARLGSYPVTGAEWRRRKKKRKQSGCHDAVVL